LPGPRALHRLGRCRAAAGGERVHLGSLPRPRAGSVCHGREVGAPMKLLLLQLKRIGDSVLTTPALAALREALPDARIGVCLMEPCAGLAPALPGVDEVFIIRRRERNTRLWFRLAFRPNDACVDFTGNDRSAFLSFL